MARDERESEDERERCGGKRGVREDGFLPTELGSGCG